MSKLYKSVMEGPRLLYFMLSLLYTAGIDSNPAIVHQFLTQMFTGICSSQWVTKRDVQSKENSHDLHVASR